VAWQALAKQSIGTFGCSNAIVATLCFFIMDRRICAGSRHLPALFFALVKVTTAVFHCGASGYQIPCHHKFTTILGSMINPHQHTTPM
jgi:hypothetical protein